jgi:hypothetical protein
MSILVHTGIRTCSTATADMALEMRDVKIVQFWLIYLKKWLTFGQVREACTIHGHSHSHSHSHSHFFSCLLSSVSFPFPFSKCRS